MARLHPPADAGGRNETKWSGAWSPSHEWRKDRTQAPPGPEYSGRDGPDGLPGDLGDLAVVEALNVAERDQDPEVTGQCGQRPVDVQTPSDIGFDIVWRWWVVRRVARVPRRCAAPLRSALLPSTRHVSSGDVDGNAMDPRHECACAAEGPEPAKCPDERFLREVLGIGIVPRENPHQLVDPPMMTVDELVECQPVSAGCLLNKDLIVIHSPLFREGRAGQFTPAIDGGSGRMVGPEMWARPSRPPSRRILPVRRRRRRAPDPAV